MCSRAESRDDLRRSRLEDRAPLRLESYYTGEFSSVALFARLIRARSRYIACQRPTLRLPAPGRLDHRTSGVVHKYGVG